MRPLLSFFRFLFILAIIGVVLAVVSVYLIRHPATFDRNSLGCYRCNVILISIDTLGAKHTSVYDRTLDTTPFLAQLAGTRGIVFAHAYANAPWELPSHTAMFTGAYPWTLGMNLSTNRLPDTAKTIFSAVKSHGYSTVGFSDGLSVNPITNLTQGIDEFHGSLAVSDWNDLPKMFIESAAWLSARQGEQPFFMLLRPFETHDPYGDPGTAGAVTTHDIVSANEAPGGPTRAQTARFEQAYHMEVRLTDSALRDFFTAFDASPYAKNTIVIITADQGEEFGEHGSAGMHGITVYNEVIHVPLIFILPGGKPAVLRQTVELRSIPNTIMDLIGYGTVPEFPGQSLVPMMEGKQVANQLIITGTLFNKPGVLATYEKSLTNLSQWGVTLFPTPGLPSTILPPLVSALQGKWHVIRNATSSAQVYDLEQDPDEQQDLFPTLNKLSTSDQASIGQLLVKLNVSQ